MIENNYDTIDKKSPNVKRKSRILLSLIIVILIILSIFFYLNFTNYLPFLSETKQPDGKIEQINVQEYIKENPKLGEMPNLDKIKYNAWKTNLTINQVINSYKQKLSIEGYVLQYEDKIIFDLKEYFVLGFIKGITAVGILISLDSNPLDDYKSEVIYSTGDILYFEEIIEWYQSQ